MNYTKVTETRTLSMSALRRLCIKNDWYTSGTAEEYDRLLVWVDALENIATEDIVEIAKDIIEHSNIEEDGRTEAEVIESVAFEVMRVCNNFIRIEED